MPVAELEAQFDAAARDRKSADIVAIGDRLVVARRLDELAGAPIVTIRLGPALAIVVLPGEVFLEHGLRIRAASPFADTLVAAYNDNTLQYIPTEAAFPDGAYEVDGGWRYIRPGEGERMADEAIRLLETLRAVGPGGARGAEPLDGAAGSVREIDRRRDDPRPPLHQVGLRLPRPLEQPVRDRERPAHVRQIRHEPLAVRDATGRPHRAVDHLDRLSGVVAAVLLAAHRVERPDLGLDDVGDVDDEIRIPGQRART